MAIFEVTSLKKNGDFSGQAFTDVLEGLKFFRLATFAEDARETTFRKVGNTVVKVGDKDCLYAEVVKNSFHDVYVNFFKDVDIDYMVGRLRQLVDDYKDSKKTKSIYTELCLLFDFQKGEYLYLFDEGTIKKVS